MSNTVITNYTDLNGPSTKADSSVVVIVNKDGSLSVDENLLDTLMGTDGSQSAGISVVRVGHEGAPDDATDSDSEADDKVPHVTLSVDSYYNEPNSIIKYDSGAEMLQSLRIETRENSLLGFQNDHCYTPLTSPGTSTEQRSEGYSGYDEPIIEIKQQSPPKSIPSSKKITILEQKIIPKGKKILINPTDAVVLKGKDVLNKPLPTKPKQDIEKEAKTDDSESSSISSSEESIQDRDSDSDYKDAKDKSGPIKKTKAKPRILKAQAGKSKLEPKSAARLKTNKNILKREIKEKLITKSIESQLRDLEQPRVKASPDAASDTKVVKQTPKPVKKEKKTPAHMTALLSDITSLFSTPDVIRRVSTDTKTPGKESTPEVSKPVEVKEKPRILGQKSNVKPKPATPTEKSNKGFDLIPQIDDASLAQILQDTTGISTAPVKSQPTITTAHAMNSPGLAGPLSPTLDLLGGLQPEEEGLTEDLLMHVAQLVESSENLQEVIDKQVLGKVDTLPTKAAVASPFQQPPNPNLYTATPTKSAKSLLPRKDPIEIVRRDGRVITLPPIEAPATRSSKRKSQIEPASSSDAPPTAPPAPAPPPPLALTPEPQLLQPSRQYVNKKAAAVPPKKQQDIAEAFAVEKASAESQESWNSEDDPYRLWCICRQPHNNRFMICCDGCEDWFHGKCVNITKVMGQQMEEQGIEWRCPNCVKKTKSLKPSPKLVVAQKKRDSDEGVGAPRRQSSDVGAPGTPRRPHDARSLTPRRPPGACIVCKKPARASSIYCSDACILKHAQDSLAPPAKDEPGATPDRLKAESRVIVFERKTGKCLAGPNAPTAENLKTWLQKNPTFEVVRPGTLSAIKPKLASKRPSNEPHKIQTTLNFERVPKKASPGVPAARASTSQEPAAGPSRPPGARAPRPPASPRTVPPAQFYDSPAPKPATPARPAPSPADKKQPRPSTSKQSQAEKASVSPAASRRKDLHSERRMGADPIRDNVRKALEEQIGLRMKETAGPKFSHQETAQFARDTEAELHELFKDVGVKYKAKYRSLMFNIKDRKNLSLWEKICEKVITPKQLVRLSPEELASQELAQWRDKESKYQLELIKKSELDLLAASKTYVLKTHKGEEVMEAKESISTDLDSSVPVEDVVSALNDSTVGEGVVPESSQESGTAIRKMSADSGDKYSSKKREREDSDKSHAKKSKKDSKRDSDRRSSRKRSGSKTKEDKPRRSERRSSRLRSPSRDRSKVEKKADSKERSRHRSRSRTKSKRSKSRDRSRSKSAARERSASRRRSRSRDRRRKRSRSPPRTSTDEKVVTRSRSQENVSSKSKNDSTDSDSVERPKSAMMKESHPEYDPHEPMITSAFSEEDLRKSREDVYDDAYKPEELEMSNVTFDASKSFSLGESAYAQKRGDRPSEAESDQEPSSTVDNASATVWNGCINMVDVARFYVAAHEVSGVCADLEEDLSAELDIVGRINPDTVWDYINKMKRSGNKDIVVLRLQAANDEEKMQYIALYSYLSSRNRLGVVKVSNTTTVKDFYILPLPASVPLPAVLLPLEGPGLDDAKSHLLIAIVVRQRKKRAAPHIPTDIIPAKVARASRKKSYTPPPSVASSILPSGLLQPPYSSPALSSSVKDKIAASLAAADEDEAYSPGSSSNESLGVPPAGPPSDKLRTKMEELNRQIEEQKQQIRKMAQADSSVDEDEAYSPSRPMTPSPPPAAVPTSVTLEQIALPSNLQEILATIKQRSETATAAAATTDIDMRLLPP
ncbi:death-inducer obliterator 1 isoform X1 [Plutella xylostella]|uniref:death-inducer obliterator 1 isoform X1 n=1 Tax=Plutella xylostella TaxID=51655 RepID=UPI0020326DB2|nr:death-inducer obliterator 1 isoform X1 [Plutella xylostella]